uniref:tRNA (34-2'-O)-methyltransferase regulator WDR6 n=1 Tax=Saccoglossus kowalevskii TaxID=10224 RepID=A0ABM0MEY9_SACKO|nr:PREDICTED: WD repeat-containing protein 6-like [Saccoglossus kowalevskii]
MKSLKSIVYVGPVTALRIYQGYILSGEGPYLHIYLLNGKELLTQNVLHWCNIHGIQAGTDAMFAVHGQKALRIVKFDTESNRIAMETDITEFEDWIKDVKWLEGVIFSINYKHSKLCSVSDDRSIRLWQMDDLVHLSELPSTPIMVLYGHSARVWDAVMMDESIVSIGEGSSIWSLATSEKHQLVVRAIFIQKSKSMMGKCLVFAGLLIMMLSQQDPMDAWFGGRSPPQIQVYVFIDISVMCYLMPDNAGQLLPVILPQNKGIVLGDRRGTVHLYPTQGSDNAEKGTGPLQSLVSIHGKGGVTDVCSHGDFIYTAGRDGKYKQHRFQNGLLQLLNSSKVYKGFEWVEKMTFKDNGSLEIQGFHAAHFILWNVQHNEKLLEVECGGGHRSYGFAYVLNSAVFVYLKARNVIICQTPVDTVESQRVVKHSLHWKEITCACHLGTIGEVKDSVRQHHVIASGSEDTTINILAISEINKLNQVKVLKNLHSHISSVRALYAITLPSSGQNLQAECCKLLFSAGGRAALKCWKVAVKQSTSFRGIEEAEETVTLQCDVELLGVHGTTDGRGRRRAKRSDDMDEDSDTRHMSLTAWNGQQDEIYYLAVASSDAILRLFSFDLLSRQFTLLGDSCWHDHCILVTKHLYLTPDNPAHCCAPTIFTGATDGIIAFWDVEAVVQELGKQKHTLKNSSDDDVAMETDATVSSKDVAGKRCDCIRDEQLRSDLSSDKRTSCNKTTLSSPISFWTSHQSGVNSLAVLQVKDDIFVIASGGDDNGVSLLLIHVDDSNFSISVIDMFKIPSAHAAQVTGAEWLDSSTLVTVSIDQRLCTWKVTLDHSSIQQVDLQFSKFVSVADLSCMEFWVNRQGKQYYLLSGVGFQLFQNDGT